MSLAELVLILIVALVAFGPNQLPDLANKLGKFYLKVTRIKTKWSEFLYEQKQQLILEENIEKAREAEAKAKTAPPG